MAWKIRDFRYSRSRPCRLVSLLLFVLASFYLCVIAFSPLSDPHRNAQQYPELNNLDARIYHPLQDVVIPLPIPDHAIPPEARIGKLTMVYPGPAPTYTRAIQSHEPHNRLHGYPMMVLRQSLLEGSTVDVLWNKPAYILAVLLEEMRKDPGKRLEWLCWFDADTVLLNPNIPLSLFLPPRALPGASDIHILLTRDKYALNNGVFLIRVSPLSIMLFAAIVTYRGYFPSKELAWKDQSAMIELLLHRNEFRNMWRVVPQRWFNAYAGYAGYGNAIEPEVVLADEEASHPQHMVRRGDMLVHFPGWLPEDRDKIMQRYLDSVQSNVAWAVELSNLSLKAEVEDYWKQERHAHKVKRARAGI